MFYIQKSFTNCQMVEENSSTVTYVDPKGENSATESAPER